MKRTENYLKELAEKATSIEEFLEESRKFAIKKSHINNLMSLIVSTIEFNAYSIPEFFEKIKERKIEATIDDLLDDEDIMTDYKKAALVKEAQKTIYGFKNQLIDQPIDIDISDTVKRHQRINILDAFRSNSNNSNNKPDDEEKFEELKKELVNKAEEVVDNKAAEETKSETVTEDTKETNTTDTSTTAADAIVEETVVDNDTKIKISRINKELVSRVPKDTIITTDINTIPVKNGFFVSSINFPNGVTNNITVDAGLILPDYNSIIVTDENVGMIAVPIDDKLANKIISTPMYKLTKEEIDHVKTYYFDNLGLYHVYDFSNIKGIKEFNSENKKKFSEILSKVAEEFRDKNNNSVPRFRFTEFNWINNFTVVSDDKAKSPLAYANETSNVIANIEVTVKDGEIKTVKPITKEQKESVAVA